MFQRSTDITRQSYLLITRRLEDKGFVQLLDMVGPIYLIQYRVIVYHDLTVIELCCFQIKDEYITDDSRSIVKTRPQEEHKEP